MARICTKLHLRNSPPTVDHSNYEEETNSQRSMSGTQPANAAVCDTWKIAWAFTRVFSRNSVRFLALKTPTLMNAVTLKLMYRTVCFRLDLVVGCGGYGVSLWHSESLTLLHAVSGVGFTWANCSLRPSSRFTAKLWRWNGFRVSCGRRAQNCLSRKPEMLN